MSHNHPRIYFIHAGDGRVVERRQRRCVVEELRPTGRVGGNVTRHDFERDGAADFRIACAKQITDAARADLVEQLVLADRLDHAATGTILIGL